MSCANNNRSNSMRNIEDVKYDEENYPVIYSPNFPITHSAFPYIDSRQVRITPLPINQVSNLNVPAYTMTYSMACDNCIRNRKVIIAP